MSRSRQRAIEQGKRRRWTPRLAAFLAIFLQIFLVQSHVHARAPLPGAAYQQLQDAVSVSAPDEASHHTQAACALCQAQAESRSVPPRGPDLAAPSALPKAAFIGAMGRLAVERAHSWRSRAPPADL